ncbi:MAG: multiheme c-type cytochrome [Pseudomonadota bacterium]
MIEISGLNALSDSGRAWSVAFFVTLALAISGFGANAVAGPAKAVGAMTCGASTCHSAEKPWPNSSVTQQEFVVWKQKDPHAKAYETLTGERAQSISRRLGLGDATQASLCLSCHSYTPEPEEIETTFDHTLGVQCEACHGKASEWLGVHQAGLYFYQRNVDEGMYPTTDAKKRAELCLSCHVGSQDKFVNHNMLAVGHPRLPFELGFYTWFSEGTPGKISNYSHFKVDDDYLQRKPWPFGVRVWAIGQAIQARTLLELLTDPKTGSNGAFPEFAFFECHSCHNAQVSGQGFQGTLGLPRLNDANLFFVEVAAGLVDPGLAASVRSDIDALRSAKGQGWPAIRAVAGRLKSRLDQLVARLDTHKYTVDDTRRAIREISAGAQRGVFSSYIAAEQAVLATGSLVDELERLRELTPQQTNAAQSAVSRGLAAFVSVDRYSQGELRAALRDVAAVTTQ